MVRNELYQGAGPREDSPESLTYAKLELIWAQMHSLTGLREHARDEYRAIIDDGSAALDEMNNDELQAFLGAYDSAEAAYGRIDAEYSLLVEQLTPDELVLYDVWLCDMRLDAALEECSTLQSSRATLDPLDDGAHSEIEEAVEGLLSEVDGLYARQFSLLEGVSESVIKAYEKERPIPSAREQFESEFNRQEEAVVRAFHELEQIDGLLRGPESRFSTPKEYGNREKKVVHLLQKLHDTRRVLGEIIAGHKPRSNAVIATARSLLSDHLEVSEGILEQTAREKIGQFAAERISVVRVALSMKSPTINEVE